MGAELTVLNQTLRFRQVVYTGLLQMFLTPRSVCMLVCNAETFEEEQCSGRDTQQLAEDITRLQRGGVLDWLRCISRRVPENNVILVATKCDLVGGSSHDVGRRIERACRTWLTSWVRDGMQSVRVEDGVSLTSCCSTAETGQGGGGNGKLCPVSSCWWKFGGQVESSTAQQPPKEGWVCDWRESTEEDLSPSLLHRLVNNPDGSGPRGAQMVLPQSWDIALTVLEALELGRYRSFQFK